MSLDNQTPAELDFCFITSFGMSTNEGASPPRRGRVAFDRLLVYPKMGPGSDGGPKASAYRRPHVIKFSTVDDDVFLSSTTNKIGTRRFTTDKSGRFDR